MDKAKMAKAAGIGGATLLLFLLIQDLRVELNELRERVTRLETIGDIYE